MKDAAKRTPSTRTLARRLEAARAPLPKGSPEAARAAFPAHDSAPAALPVSATPSAGILEVVRAAEADLARRGVPGAFTVVRHVVTVQLSWAGAKHHEAEAELAVVSALRGAGYVAGSVPRMGVRVTVPEGVEVAVHRSAATAPAWASLPAAVHASRRDLSGSSGRLCSVEPADMDPDERAGSLVGRVLRVFVEV